MPISIQYTLSYNGLSIGAGTSFLLTEMQGIEDMPDVRNSDLAKPLEHGMFQGLDLLNQRDVTLTFLLMAPTPDAYDSLVQQLSAAFAPQVTELPLVLSGLGGQAQQVMCRPRKRSVPRKPDGVGISGTASVLLTATDPRIYDAALQTPSVGLASSGTGISWPIRWPISWGGAISPNTLAVTNAGTISGPGVFSIAGPVTNPTIVNQATGQSLAMAITLSSTDLLQVDLGAHSITLNPGVGQASRRSALQPGSSWWLFPPGVTTCLYQAASFSASTLTCSYRSSWV